MRKELLIAAAVILWTCSLGLAQNTNSSMPTERPRTTNTNRAKPAPQPVDVVAPTPPPQTTPAAAAKKSPAVTTPQTTGSAAVLAAFNKLRAGIEKADVEAVTSVYWKAPGLVLFNNNGTVTKGWEQMRKNRESSYPELKDVKLDVRDISIIMLGRDGAVLSCLWTQSQTYKGTPETATGRMTLVFKRVGKDWKAVHLHTSPDKEDPSRVLPSEQVEATPKP